MDTSQHLTQFMATHLPIAADLGIRVSAYDGKVLRLIAPLEPNRNDKMTAFGGSIYCVCVMACWGMVYLKALEHGVRSPKIVVSHAEIDYLKPVNEDVVAECLVDSPEIFAAFYNDYDHRGKAKVRLQSTVRIQDHLAVMFNGDYALLS